MSPVDAPDVCCMLQHRLAKIHRCVLHRCPPPVFCHLMFVLLSSFRCTGERPWEWRVFFKACPKACPSFCRCLLRTWGEVRTGCFWTVQIPDNVSERCSGLRLLVSPGMCYVDGSVHSSGKSQTFTLLQVPSQSFVYRELPMGQKSPARVWDLAGRPVSRDGTLSIALLCIYLLGQMKKGIHCTKESLFCENCF